jgi:peptide/nickel transport system permease protein/peptide/nickel transport system substrate-binding protein
LPAEYWAANVKINEPYDIESAKKLLTEAGFPNGLTLNVVGLPDQIWQQRQEILISMLARAGIKLNVVRLAPGAGLSRFFNDRQDDIFISLWTGRPDPSTTLNGLFGAQAFFNAGRVDPTGGRLTQAITDTRSTAAPLQRKVALDHAQQIVHDEALVVPLNFESQIIAHSKRVQGFVPNLLGKQRFDDVFIK